MSDGASTGVVMASGVEARVALSIDTVSRILSCSNVTVSPVSCRLGTHRTFWVVVWSLSLLSYDPIAPFELGSFVKEMFLPTDTDTPLRNLSSKLRFYRLFVVRRLALSFTTIVLMRSRNADLIVLAVHVVV